MGGAPVWGSSPLARGLPAAPAAPQRGRRIIPARAGFTPAAISPPSSTTDHPRSRGVYAKTMGNGQGKSGSSPLARGLLRHRLHDLGHVGIIPARAGFTLWSMWATVGAQDHPRSRGVYERLWEARLTCLGSSPLARGLPTTLAQPLTSPRIIPARAGFTSLVLVTGRSGGGSSPLARGLPPSTHAATARTGIIPARAGFTS